MVSHPVARGAFFLLWSAYLVWAALTDSDRWFLRWPMMGFAVVALGLAVHFFRSAARRTVSDVPTSSRTP